MTNNNQQPTMPASSLPSGGGRGRGPFKRCTQCGEEKPMTEYYQRRFCKDGTPRYESWCKKCRYEYNLSLKRKKKKQGAYRDENDGRLYVNPTGRGGRKIYWTGDMLSILRRYYPNTPSPEVAEMIGVSKCTVTKKAKELGLKKDKHYMLSYLSRGGRLGYRMLQKSLRENPPTTDADTPSPTNMDDIIKRCPCCGQSFPLSVFGLRKCNGREIPNPWCPTCTKIKRKGYTEKHKAKLRQRNAERLAAMAPKEGHLRCLHCGQEKPMEEFLRRKDTISGYRNVCKTCFAIQRREYYKRSMQKKGVFMDPQTGRLMDHRGPHCMIYWTGDMLSILRRYYPNTNNIEVAEMIGVAKCTVTKKAKELGLHKSSEYIHRTRSASSKLGAVIIRRKRSIVDDPR